MKEQMRNFRLLRMLFLCALVAVCGIWSFNASACAAERDVALGSESEIKLYIGDSGKLVPDTINTDSPFYQYKEQIARGDYSVNVENAYDEETYNKVIQMGVDNTYTALSKGYVTADVKIYGEQQQNNNYFNNGEYSEYPYETDNSFDNGLSDSNYDDEYYYEEKPVIYSTSYTLKVSLYIDMSKVSFEKTSLTGYQLDGSYYNWLEFDVKVNGLEGVNGEDLDEFEFKSTNEDMYISYSLENGVLRIETSSVGPTKLIFNINGYAFTINLKISVIKLSCGNSLVMKTGKTRQIKVKGTSDKVKWKSSNSKVASISSNGKLKTKKMGNAIISATIGEFKLGCVISVLTPNRMKVINMANKIGKNWTYSQPKRMQTGYYDCSSLVWKSYRLEGKVFGSSNYAPVAADIAKYCADRKKTVKGNAEKNIQKLKYIPGALTFKTGADNGRYKGIYHVEMFVGYTLEGFDSNGKAIVGTKWAARPDNYWYGEIWAQP